jgi:hypothetical protein
MCRLCRRARRLKQVVDRASGDGKTGALSPPCSQVAGRSAAALRQCAGWQVSQQCSSAMGKSPEVGLELRENSVFGAKTAICPTVQPHKDGGLRRPGSRIANPRNRTAAVAGGALNRGRSQRCRAISVEIASARRTSSDLTRRGRSRAACEARRWPRGDQGPCAEALVQPPKKARAKCKLQSMMPNQRMKPSPECTSF